MNISFFAKPYFWGVSPKIVSGPFLHRGSSLIRGEQIASFLGAKYNPESGYENDICIYVKPRNLDKIKDGDYVDVIDEEYLIALLAQRPKINVIAASLYTYEVLRDKLKNKVVFIPQHHCNFERAKRNTDKATTAGFLSHPSNTNYGACKELEKELKKIGIEFLTCFDFKSRLDVVNFYKKIDVQIIGHFGRFNYKNPFAQPLKIINAASFGIPTIAVRREGYKSLRETTFRFRT